MQCRYKKYSRTCLFDGSLAPVMSPHKVLTKYHLPLLDLPTFVIVPGKENCNNLYIIV